MSPELQALAAEAATDSPLAADGAQPAETPAAPTIDVGNMAALVSPAVAVVGNFGCDVFRVTRLEGGEVFALSKAICDVADAYNMLGQLDPRSAAWLGLGATVAGIAMNRRALPPQHEPEVPRQGEPDADAAPIQ